MANIGELFKFLGSNKDFHELCLDAEKSTEQIIEDVFQNEELITSLRNIVQDDNIIKNKMNVIIGQKRKQTQNKKSNDISKEPTEKEPKEKEPKDKELEEKEPEVEDDFIDFKYKPFNKSKVIRLDKFSYMESVGYKRRLVTTDFEMYY
jgi:hypothetical protein